MNQQWKLVPVEPTDEMLKVDVDPVLCIGGPSNPRVGQWRLGMYRAMLAAAPVPPAGGEVDIPDYFVAACDKFDWTPEEALRFYAEGKHFDTVDGRTRILCTGAIASHALKGMGGEYADMKGMEPAGGEVEVEVLAVVTLGSFSAEELGEIDIEPRMKALERIQQQVVTSEDVSIELLDRAHVTRLQAEVAALQARLTVADQRVDDLQSDLTKALELLRWFYAHANVHQVGTVMMDSARDFLAHQSAPAAKDAK